MIQATGLLTAASPGAGGGHAGGETLVPLYEPHARQLFFQGVQSTQNPAGLKADLPAERPGDADQDFGDVLLPHQPPQRLRELRARHDLEGPRYRPRGIRDGDAGAYLSEVEGNDTPTGVCERRQWLLLRAGEPMAQDLARPLQGFRDGLEVAASGLGHRRPAATAAA